MNSNTHCSAGPVALQSASAASAATAHQEQLLKPPGALGRLEDLAIRLAAMQGNPWPTVERVQISLFAADHGVAEEGVSAFPQSVTAAMLRCFPSGGSAIGVLAHELGAELEVINLGTAEELEPIPGVLDHRVGPGTANFALGPAMGEAQLVRCLEIGREAARRAHLAGTQLFIGAEMGIGNTTAATALAAALLGEAPEALAGPGAGLDSDGVRRKIEIVGKALNLHRDQLSDPWETLRCLGGFEIAALTGAFMECASVGVTALVDGFICSAAALAAERLCPGTAHWLLFSHVSAEPGHRPLLDELRGEPLLDLGLKLGEGSGAAITVPLLRLACALHREMLTFAEAGVAEKMP